MLSACSKIREKLTMLQFNGCRAASSTELCRFKINCSFSAPFINASGVPQGSIFGPLVFLIFINDIVYALPNCQKLLHADDSKSFTPVSDTDDCLRLQYCLHSFTSWCKLNRLSVLVNKCSVIMFSRKRFPIQYDCKVAAKLVPRPNSVKAD